MKPYAFTWTLGMVASLHETYPRATGFLGNLLQIDDIGIAKLFLRDQIDWRKYKKLLRHVEDLLNARIVVSPSKIFEAWKTTVETLDTVDFDVTMGEPVSRQTTGPQPELW